MTAWSGLHQQPLSGVFSTGRCPSLHALSAAGGYPFLFISKSPSPSSFSKHCLGPALRTLPWSPPAAPSQSLAGPTPHPPRRSPWRSPSCLPHLGQSHRPRWKSEIGPRSQEAARPLGPLLSSMSLDKMLGLAEVQCLHL